METLSNTFWHATKHVALHSLWMVPMAAAMMPSPALAGAFAGAGEMFLTSLWNFAFEGGAVELFNNTVSGDFLGSYEVGDMSHLSAAAEPDLAADALELLR